MPKKPIQHPKKHTTHKQPSSPQDAGSSSGPIFGQPQPSPDPTGFKDPVTDQSEQELNTLEAVPEPAGNATEPILTLEQVYGSAGAAKMQAIQQAGQIVFHSVGDTGSVVGPVTQSLVADKMVTDFNEANAADVPSFFYHLGDVVYYFGEATYYYDQFYEPYRQYPAPIIAIPGNHDGVVYPGDPAPTLMAFLRNFCTSSSAQSPDSGGLLRTTMIQPGVYFTLEAPFVRILGIYSNVLEDPGVISGENGNNTILDNRQITFLTTALERTKTDNFTGAVIIAVHHPPFTGGWSTGAVRSCYRTSTVPARPPEFGRMRSFPGIRTIINATRARSIITRSRTSSPAAAVIPRSRACAPPIGRPTKSTIRLRLKVTTIPITVICAWS